MTGLALLITLASSWLLATSAFRLSSRGEVEAANFAFCWALALAVAAIGILEAMVK